MQPRSFSEALIALVASALCCPKACEAEDRPCLRDTHRVQAFDALAALQDAGELRVVMDEDPKERACLVQALLRQIDELKIELADAERDIGNAEWNAKRAHELKLASDAEVTRLRAAIQRDVDEARECNGYSRCTSSYSDMRHSISALRHPDPPASLHSIRGTSR